MDEFDRRLAKAQRAEEAAHHPLLVQDDDPAVCAHEKVGPERHQDGGEDDCPHQRARHRQHVGDRETEHEADQRRLGADEERPGQDAIVDRHLVQADVVFDPPALLALKTLHQHAGDGPKEQRREKQECRGEQDRPRTRPCMRSHLGHQDCRFSRASRPGTSRSPWRGSRPTTWRSGKRPCRRSPVRPTGSSGARPEFPSRPA